MAGNRAETSVPVKCRGFKSCWRGHAVLERERERRRRRFKASSGKEIHASPLLSRSPRSTVPLLPLPPPFCLDVGKIGNESQTVRFSSGRPGQRETWRERGGCWQSPSGKRNLYTSLLTNSSAPMLSSAFLSSRLISARGDESSSPSTTIRLSLVPHLV